MYLPPSYTPPLPKGIIIHRTKEGGGRIFVFWSSYTISGDFNAFPETLHTHVPKYTTWLILLFVISQSVYMHFWQDLHLVKCILGDSSSSPSSPFLLVFLSEAAEGEGGEEEGKKKRASLLGRRRKNCG